MCDYSLEAYKSQDAEIGEKYKLHRFPSGTFGLQVEGTANEYGCGTAACLKEGSKLLVGAEEAIFIKMETDSRVAHRDAVRFSDGREMSFQTLGSGVSIALLSLPEEKLEQPRVEAPEMVDAD